MVILVEKLKKVSRQNMEIQTISPRKTEFKVVRIGTNQYGKKYIEAVQVVSTEGVYQVYRKSLLEWLYLLSVTIIGFYVGYILLNPIQG